MLMVMDIFVFEFVKIVIVVFLVLYFCKLDFDEIVDLFSMIFYFDDISIIVERKEVDSKEDIVLLEFLRE